MAEIRENVIEWITGDDRITCTLTQQRYINRAKRIVEYYSNIGDQRADMMMNADGSAFCHLPLECLKLLQKTHRTMSEEDRLAAAERMRRIRQKKEDV